jgi:hypothetical protein
VTSGAVGELGDGGPSISRYDGVILHGTLHLSLRLIPAWRSILRSRRLVMSVRGCGTVTTPGLMGCAK